MGGSLAGAQHAAPLLSAPELAHLRRLKLQAEQKALEARLAENRLARFLLAIEARCRLEGREAVLDLATGVVQMGGGGLVAPVTPPCTSDEVSQ